MNPSKVSANRYALLDELRGLDLISMMCYHGLWDVVFLFGVQLPWYTGMPGHLWQQSICWVFILLSGFCLPWDITRTSAVHWSLGPGHWSRR